MRYMFYVFEPNSFLRVQFFLSLFYISYVHFDWDSVEAKDRGLTF